MYIPSSKSRRSLLLLFIAAILGFIWVENSKVIKKEKYYDQKMDAAKLMHKAEMIIKEYREESGYFIDPINDPYGTGLVGETQSLIVTDRGDLSAKLVSLNPNFAAVLVDVFKEAGLEEGDKVTVSTTGSFPALHVAVMSAAEALNLELDIISSIGASMFGATDENFTILDIERLLFGKGIFHYRSKAASIGGGEDIGRGLSQQGREVAIQAIKRNNLPIIRGDYLEENIDKKMELFDTENTKLYVNIGGGLSSIGSSSSKHLVDSGLHTKLQNKEGIKGTMFRFAKKGIPILQLRNVQSFARKRNLDINSEELPVPGEGEVFQKKKYNLTNTVITLSLLIVLLIVVIFFDKKQMEPKKDEINI